MTYRYEFHMLVFVTQGNCVQLVDFKPISCNQGTLLILRSGQAHNFGLDEHWDGWVILFRPEFIFSPTSLNQKLSLDFKSLPNFLILANNKLQRACQTIEQIHKDSLINSPSGNIHTLLHYQLSAFIIWLGILDEQQRCYISPSQIPLRFTQFQKLVETHFTKWTHVSEYAAHLNCTERTLTRSTIASVGVTAKSFISTRINLEAKRLLVHTNLPISAIADKLGFRETTHFSKFFKRETKCTPAEFRKKQLAENRIFI